LSDDNNKIPLIPKPPEKREADDAARPELKVDDGADKIGLKGDGAPEGAGGIRSPLIRNQQNTPKEPAKPKAAKKEDPLARSAIAGLSNRAEEFTQISFVEPISVSAADNYFKRRLLTALGVLVIAGAGALGGYFYNSKFKSLVTEGLDYAQNKISDNDVRKKKRMKRVKRHKKRREYRQQLAAKSQVRLEGTDCKSLVNSGYMFREYKKMNLIDRLKLAECQMIYGDFKSAGRALSKEKNVIKKSSSKTLTTTNKGRAYYTLLASQLETAKFKDSEAISSHVCRVWKESHACYGRLMVMAYRGHGNVGIRSYKNLKRKSKNSLGKYAAGWFNLAAAKLHNQNSEYLQAEKLFKTALITAPKKDVYLRKEIYETYGVALYSRGEYLKLKKLMKSAKKEFAGLERAPKIKLILLSELANPSKAKRYLKSFLSRPELAVHVRGDIELIDIIGPQVMRYNLHKNYLRLLKKTKDFFLNQRLGTKNSVMTTMIWEIRSNFAMANSKTEKTIALINKFNSKYGSTAESNHLLGAAYLAGSEGRSWSMKAARAFQRSVKRKNNWEGLYGLGLATIRSGQAAGANRIIRDLDKLIKEKGQVYWSEMLKIEWYLGTKRYPQAAKLIKKWQRKQPDYVTPHKLLAKYYKLTGNLSEMNMTEVKLDKLMRRVHFASSREGISSPVGAMSLRKRPLE
jgi:tetratricopeptide (TPR) repeat protein